MKIAFYGRFSTDRQDQLSIERQRQNCCSKAEQLGYDIVKEFTDEGISGADMDRPQFVAMEQCLEGFEVDGVIVDDVDRFARSSWKLPQFIEQLALRNQFIIDSKGWDCRTDSGEFTASIYAAISKMELKKIITRTHGGLRERARQGFHTGGKTYGYRTEAIEPEDENTKHRRVVDEDQAKIVREIFEAYADGLSPRAICSDLNARGIPSPGAHWKGRKGSRQIDERTGKRGRTRDGKWWPHTIYGNFKRGTGILANQLYIGKIIWNRSTRRKKTDVGMRQRRERDQKDWIITEDETLRIIPQDLWDRVQQRRKEVRRATRPDTKGKPHKSKGRTPKYLLSTLLTCSECGRNMTLHDKTHYVCPTRKNQGKLACRNGLKVKRLDIEKLVLDKVTDPEYWDSWVAQHTEQLVSSMHEEQQRQIDRQANFDGKRDQVKAELAKVKQELVNLSSAIAEAGFSDTLKRALREKELKKQELVAQLVVVPMETTARLPSLLKAGAEERRAELDELKRRILGPRPSERSIALCRSHLRKLLGEIKLEPDYETDSLYAWIGFDSTHGTKWLLAATLAEEGRDIEMEMHAFMAKDSQALEQTAGHRVEV